MFPSFGKITVGGFVNQLIKKFWLNSKTLQTGDTVDMIGGSLKENTEVSKVVYENIQDHIYENISDEQTLTIAGTTTCTPKPGNIIGERPEQLPTRDKLKDQDSKTKEKVGGMSPKMTPKRGLIRSVLEKNITRKLSDSRTYVKKTDFDELVTGAFSKRARVRSISRDDSGVLGRSIFQTNTETRETHSDGEDVIQKTRTGIRSFLGVKLSASRDKTVLDGFATDIGSKGTRIRSISRDNGVGFYASRGKTVLDGFATGSGSKGTRIRSISRDNGVGFSASRDETVLDGFATESGSKGTGIRSISRDNAVGFSSSRDKTVLDEFATDTGSKGTRIRSISRDNGVGLVRSVCERDTARKLSDSRGVASKTGVGIRSLFGMNSGRKKSVRELVQTFSRETEKEKSSIKHGFGISSGNAVNKFNIVTTSPEAKPRRDQGKTLFNGSRKISGDGKYSDALPLSAHCSPLLIARSRKHPIDTWSENVENSIGCSTVCRVHKECWNRKISEAYVRKDLVDPRLMRTLSENKLLYR